MWKGNNHGFDSKHNQRYQSWAIQSVCEIKQNGGFKKDENFEISAKWTNIWSGFQIINSKFWDNLKSLSF